MATPTSAPALKVQCWDFWQKSYLKIGWVHEIQKKRVPQAVRFSNWKTLKQLANSLHGPGPRTNPFFHTKKLPSTVPICSCPTSLQIRVWSQYEPSGCGISKWSLSHGYHWLFHAQLWFKVAWERVEVWRASLLMASVISNFILWVRNLLCDRVTLMIIIFAPKIWKISCKHQPRRKLSKSRQVASAQGRTVLWPEPPSPQECHGRKSQQGGGRTSQLRFGRLIKIRVSRLTGIVTKHRGRFKWRELQKMTWINRDCSNHSWRAVYLFRTSSQQCNQQVNLWQWIVHKQLFWDVGTSLMGQPGIEFS